MGKFALLSGVETDLKLTSSLLCLSLFMLTSSNGISLIGLGFRK